MNKRTAIYQEFKQHAQEKDTRTMDEICKAASGFELQAQQKFLQEYITKHRDWRSLLLYHQIGSGKTCTAITLAEKHMALYPDAKVTVILPARLRTNFIDELVSPCGMNAYISAEEFAKYHASETSAAAKAKIKRKFMNAINNKYTIISFEKFKSSAFAASSMSAWVQEFTKDRMVIIDEVHNLISDGYDNKVYASVVATNKMIRSKGSSAMLLRYLAAHAHASCKMLLLTATPIFDNISQMKELVQVLSPGTEIKKTANISDVIGALRGKVSFFPGTSPNAYPTVDFKVHEVPHSNTQDAVIERIIASQQDKDNDAKESFKSKQRIASIACLPNNAKVSKNMPLVLSNLPEYAPKVVELLKTIDTQRRGKHVVYSTFVESGVRVVEAALRKDGWVSVKEVMNNEEAWKKHAFKVYAVWDGSVKDEDKLMIKNIVNKTNNISGRRIRVILGSPSIKEGVSFKHVQHLHLLDPVWNNSAKMQVEGRAIRFCSHVDIPRDDAFLKRHVDVHIYKSTPGPLVSMTADQEIYDYIIPHKKELVTAGENALKKVAIDYFLFRNMYAQQRRASPPAPAASSLERADSHVSLDENVHLTRRNRVKTKKNTCPKPRRPDPITDQCRPGYYSKPNPHGDNCCYKLTKKQVAASQAPRQTTAPTTTKKKVLKKPQTNAPQQTSKECPKGRSPINGACPEGFKLRLNKKGSACCFKVRVAKSTTK